MGALKDFDRDQIHIFPRILGQLWVDGVEGKLKTESPSDLGNYSTNWAREDG